MVAQFGFLSCVKASPGTPTKISSTATPGRTTWHCLKCLKVNKTLSHHVYACVHSVLQMSISVSLSFHSSGTVKPLYWHKPVYELDPSDPNNNGFINDDLIIWMREAAFPNFKKLYGVLLRANKPFTNGLPAGNYSIDITYSILSLLSRVALRHPIVCFCLHCLKGLF